MAMRPPIPSITLSRRAKAALWTLGVLVVVIIALVQATGVYINWLWFGDVGYRSVYTTVFWTRVVLFFVLRHSDGAHHRRQSRHRLPAAPAVPPDVGRNSRTSSVTA